MITRAVTIEDIDDLYLTYNGSALYRRALRDEMELRDVDPDELRDLFERAREQGYTKDEIVEETNRYGDSRHSSPTQRSNPLYHRTIRPPKRLRIAPTATPRQRATFPGRPHSSWSP